MSAAILCDIACQLGEGPSYDPVRQTLYWFDILGRRLLEKRWPDGETIIHDLPFMASAIAAIDENRQLLVGETGLHIRDVATGALTVHKPVEAGNALTRSNDSRVHPSGALWFSTMAKDEGSPAGSIYWYCGGEVRRLFGDLSIPNSICFSPDGRIGYFTDTPTKTLMRVDLDAANGLPVGEPHVLLHGGGDGWIDGSVVDADGVIWNAKWGGGRVDAFSPDGSFLRSIAVPARQSSCPAFVGENAGRMAVTSAWKGMTVDERAVDPLAGRTFLLDLPVKGRFDPPIVL